MLAKHRYLPRKGDRQDDGGSIRDADRCSRKPYRAPIARRRRCPAFGCSTPEGATPMFGLSPNTTLKGLVTVSRFLRFTKYENAPAGAADCPESGAVAAAGGVVGCWAEAGPIAAASVATV